MNNFLYVAIYNTILVIVGLIMGIFFIGLPCLVFIYLAGYWTSLAILNYRKYVEFRRTDSTTREQ